jgi:cytochrome c
MTDVRAVGMGGLLGIALALGACDRGPLAERARERQKTLGGQLPPNVRAAPEPPERFAVGRAATGAEVAAWDIDISPNGAGLPQGRGTVAEGAQVYLSKCAMCHGATGAEGQSGPPPVGQPAAPRLVGRDSGDGFGFGKDPKLVKTVGNYWPYATTVFDYVRRTMPLNAPGTLTNSEVYAVVAYLLAENQVIDKTAVMDSLTLPAVKMPAHDKFVVDDRKGGPGFK